MAWGSRSPVRWSTCTAAGSPRTARAPAREPRSRSSSPGRRHDPEPPRPSAQPRSRRPLAILIVEDNTDLAATYRTLLERQGHHVTAVHTGADALTATESDVFDVVLCDLGLPDTDGYTVARTVRARPHGSRPRLIAVSGFSQGTDRSLSRAAGFDAHLAKPLPLNDLLDLLDEPA